VTPVSVRDALPADAEAIARVARASWTVTYRDIFEPAFIDGFLAQYYSTDALATAAQRAAEREDTEFLVAERDGEVVAYAHFAVGERGPELFRIYAHPDHYGTGVGSALLDELHRRIDGAVDTYILDVHSRNERGRAFYDRHGFVIVDSGSTPDGHVTLRRTLHPVAPRLPRPTDRLTLRELTDADTSALHRIFGDAETMRHIGRTRQPKPDLEATARVLQSFRRHAELHGFSMCAIDERDGDEVVGVAGLDWVEGHGPDVQVDYILRRDRWGRGYATEVLRELLRLGHDELGLERIVALAYPENDASRHVMEKAGMRPDGMTFAYGHDLTRHISERSA
jgi:[ribosomal protein S5]-alanine N-acetyltransferase